MDNSFLKPQKKNIEKFNEVEIYSSKSSGYGKTMEIISKVKNLKGEYFYLPIRDSIFKTKTY